MAMSMERVNEKLEKMLKELDEAIEDKEFAKVTITMDKVQKLNKDSEGQQNDVILDNLKMRIERLTAEINDENNDLEDEEVDNLRNLRSRIEHGQEPFQKVKAVVDSLSKKGVTQEDLKMYKENQKADNLAQIDAIKQVNGQVATMAAYIESNYIDKIKDNDVAIKTIQELKQKKAVLEKLDSKTDAIRINMLKADMRNKASELTSKGVNIQDFETFPAVLDQEMARLNTDSDVLAQNINTDMFMPQNLKEQFGLNSVGNANDLKDKYKQIVGTRQKNVAKITTLEAENRQIDRTMATLEREEQVKNSVYREDGSQKSDEEIADDILSDERYRREIEEDVNEKYKGKIPFFSQMKKRWDFFRQNENLGIVKAALKTITTKTKTVKKIEACTEAARMGKQMSAQAGMNMEARRNEFINTIKKEASKKMSKNPNLTENDLRDSVTEKAYKQALGENENEGRER